MKIHSAENTNRFCASERGPKLGPCPYPGHWFFVIKHWCLEPGHWFLELGPASARPRSHPSMKKSYQRIQPVLFGCDDEPAEWIRK